jgi:hypothetical protein
MVMTSPFAEFPDFYYQDFCKPLIIQDLRDLASCLSISIPSTPPLHYSIIPCGWPPLLQQISLMDNGVLDKIEKTPVPLY